MLYDFVVYHIYISIKMSDATQPSLMQIYEMIEYHAKLKIKDEMRRDAFLMNAQRALHQGNREYLLRYLQRVRPSVQGGYFKNYR